MACSSPPVYWSTGIQWFASSESNGCVSSFGLAYRRKYQDESTKVSMVSYSRRASRPDFGHVVRQKSGFSDRGLYSFGSRTGSWSFGTETMPSTSQYTIGIGAPQ